MSQARVGENSNSRYNNSFNTNSFNTFNHVFNLYNSSSSDERAEILSWLSQLDPWIRHRGIRDDRVEHVGDWLLRTKEYQSWFDGIRGGEPSNSALFCHGNPGVGKTYIRYETLSSMKRGCC